MKARVPYVDRIWRVTSSIDLDAQLAPLEAFERLRPLLEAQGTEVELEGHSLTYHKTNPVAQDKLATFTSGTLSVVEEGANSRLIYDVGSTALFLCFLAPLAFLAFGQFAEFLNEIEKPDLIKEMAEKEKEKAENPEEEEKIELHWIDQLLGAPEPKQRGEEDDADGARGGTRSEDAEEKDDEPEGRHSSTTAYVFAGIFLAIYLVGRVLEPYLLKRTFRAALYRPSDSEITEFKEKEEVGDNPAPTVGGNLKS